MLGFERWILYVENEVDCVAVVQQLLLGLVSKPEGIYINYHDQHHSCTLSKH